jgi:hypothetical protein
MATIKEIDIIFNSDEFDNNYINGRYDLINIKEVFTQINNNTNMLKNTLDFFKESKPIYRLHLIFLYNHYHIDKSDREISELENNLSEYDIIYLAKYSMIYNCIINFKKWFFLLDKYIQSYILHYLKYEYSNIYNFGYPLNIINYLSENGYSLKPNYEYLIKTYNLLNNTLDIHISFDICFILKKDYIIEPLIIKLYDKSLLITINKLYNKLYSYNEYVLKKNICSVLKILLNNHIIDVITTVTNFRYNYNLLRDLYIYDYNIFGSCIIYFILLQYKITLTNKNINIWKKIILLISDNIFIKEIKWFNNNFTKFNDYVCMKVLKRYKKLKLLKSFIFLNLDNIIINHKVYKYISELDPSIIINFTKPIMISFIKHLDFNFLNSYIDIDKKELNKCINICLSYPINKNNLHTHIKILKFYKSLFNDNYKIFLFNNLTKYKKYNNIIFRERLNHLVKYKLIDFNNKTSLRKNLKKYFTNNLINKIIKDYK